VRLRRYWIVWIWGLVLACIIPCEASAGWDKVKRYIRSEVQIQLEKPERLELYHPATNSKVVMTIGQSPDSTIYRKLVRRRGGNPYWVWFAGKQFSTISAAKWSKILRVEFLRIVRRPRR
jgi:hypothetical protein